MIKNSYKIYLTAFTAALALFCFFCAPGCKTEEKQSAHRVSADLKIVYVDTDGLISDFPELTEFMKKKEKESLNIKALLFSGKKLSIDEQNRIKKTTSDFIKQEEGLIAGFVDTVREACIEVADEKKYDLVINNKSSSPVIEYGGVDITEEVRAKLTQMKKNGKSPDAGKKGENKEEKEK